MDDSIATRARKVAQEKQVHSSSNSSPDKCKDVSYVGGSKTDLDTISELGEGGVSVIKMDQIDEKEKRSRVVEDSMADLKPAAVTGKVGVEGSDPDAKSSVLPGQSNPALKERELAADLHRMTERCIKLQIALNQEKANVEALTNRSGSHERLAHEAITLREALDRKTHDLQAIIWKMNELHLINKTFSEKMVNRDQHVNYLEECLIDLQSKNRALVLEKQEGEAKLRDELENLQVLVDGMTIPLWQFGEIGVTKRTLASRVVIPIRGCVRHGDEESSAEISGLDSHASSGMRSSVKSGDSLSSRLKEGDKENVALDDAAGSGSGLSNASISKKEKDLHRKELSLQKKEDEIQRREDNVEHWMMDVEKKKRAVREKEVDLSLKISEMQEREELIRNIQDKLHSTEEEMREWELDIRRKEDDVLDREEEMHEREMKLELKMRELKKAEEEFHIIKMAKSRELKKREEELRALQLEYLKKQDITDLSEITKKSEELSVKETELKERESMIDLKLKQVYAKEQDIQRAIDTYERMRQDIVVMEQELYEKDDKFKLQVRDFEASREKARLELAQLPPSGLWYYSQFIRNVFHGCREKIITFWAFRWDRISHAHLLGGWRRWLRW
mmetsp:Transcript_55572/g.66813  ORF Transcript_55572/g.66813 Transcript_55572/m.66813 type:complete len:620 (-) Transcript_55572:191-2050(-)